MGVKTAFALRSAAVGSVVAGAWFGVVWPGGIPLALVAFYALLAARESGSTPDLLENRAEDVYFLGYISTLASLGGILLVIVRAGQLPDDPVTLLPMIVVALGATVAGLLGMATLKDIAQRRRRSVESESWQDRVLTALNRLVELSVVAPAGAAPGSEEGNAVASASVRVNSTLEALNTELTTLKQHLTTLNTSVSNNTVSANDYAKSVKEVEQTLTLFVSMVKKLIPDATAAGQGMS